MILCTCIKIAGVKALILCSCRSKDAVHCHATALPSRARRHYDAVQNQIQMFPGGREKKAKGTPNLLEKIVSSSFRKISVCIRKKKILVGAPGDEGIL